MSKNKKNKKSSGRTYYSSNSVLTSASKISLKSKHSNSGSSIEDKIERIKRKHAKEVKELYGLDISDSKKDKKDKKEESYTTSGLTPLQELLARTTNWGPKKMLKRQYSYSNITPVESIKKDPKKDAKNSVPIEKPNVIKLGSIVTVRDMDSGEEMTFEIVNSLKQAIPTGWNHIDSNNRTYKDVYIDDFDVTGEYVRDDTPIAQKLHDKTAGKEVRVNNHRYKIIGVKNSR